MNRFIALLIIFFGLSLKSVAALSLTDIFPPVTMKQSSKTPPQTAISREVKSDNTYANDVNNSQQCNWTITLDQTYDPKSYGSGDTNPDGSQKSGNKPYEARDIVKKIDLDKPLSNDYFRNVHYFAARGEIECDIHQAGKPFKNYRPEGQNATVRSTPRNVLLYEKGLLIEDAILSLDPNNDSLGQDEQLFWACAGECVKLSAIKSGCRPVTVAELGYYFYNRGKSPMYQLLPGNELKNISYSPRALAILANFRGLYEKRFNQGFYVLRDGIYKTAYSQLDPLPRVPENSKFQLTRYNNPEMTNPDIVKANRTLPNAGPASSVEAGITWSLYSPKNQKDLPHTDPCSSFTTANSSNMDKPSPLGIIEAFVKGIFGWVFDDPLKVTKFNQAQYQIEKTSVDNTKKFEKFAVNMIPNKDLKERGFKSVPSASKYNPETPIDVGFRANKILAGGRSTVSDYLQPKSWKGASSPPNTANPNPRPGSPPPSTPGTIGNSVTDFCQSISTNANSHSLDPALLAAVIQIESGGNPNAISPQGAVGLMQVMPSDGIAGTFMCPNGPCFAGRPTTEQLLKPDFNIQYGTQLLSDMVNYYGSLRDGLMHYGPMDYGYTYADTVLSLFNSNPNVCH